MPGRPHILLLCPDEMRASALAGKNRCADDVTLPLTFDTRLPRAGGEAGAGPPGAMPEGAFYAGGQAVDGGEHADAFTTLDPQQVKGSVTLVRYEVGLDDDQPVHLMFNTRRPVRV